MINRHVCHHRDSLSCATPISRRVAKKHGWGRLSPRRLSEGKKTLSQRHCVRLHVYYLSYPAAIPPVKLFFMVGDGFDSLGLPLKSITGVNCTLSLDGINPYERTSSGWRNRHTGRPDVWQAAGSIFGVTQDFIALVAWLAVGGIPLCSHLLGFYRLMRCS